MKIPHICMYINTFIPDACIHLYSWLSCSGSFRYIWYCTCHNKSTLHPNQRGYLCAFSLSRSPPTPSLCLCSLLQHWHLNRGMQRLLLERGRFGDTRVVRVTHSSHPHLSTHMPRTRTHRTHCARTNTTLPVGKHNQFFHTLNVIPHTLLQHDCS